MNNSWQEIKMLARNGVHGETLLRPFVLTWNNGTIDILIDNKNNMTFPLVSPMDTLFSNLIDLSSIF